MNSVTLPPIRVGSFQKKEKIDSQYRFQIQDCTRSPTIATSKVPHTNKYYTTRQPDNELKNVKIQRRVKKIAPQAEPQVPQEVQHEIQQEITHKVPQEQDSASVSVSSLTETQTPNTITKTRNIFKEMSLASKK